MNNREQQWGTTLGIIGNNNGNNWEQYGEVQNRIIGRGMSITSSGLIIARQPLVLLKTKQQYDPCVTNNLCES